jgi:hypothetical protein
MPSIWQRLAALVRRLILCRRTPSHLPQPFPPSINNETLLHYAQQKVPVVTGNLKVDKLLSEMTLAEKITMIHGAVEPSLCSELPKRDHISSGRYRSTRFFRQHVFDRA